MTSKSQLKRLAVQHSAAALDIAKAALGDDKKAQAWMQSRNPNLGMETPINMILQGRGDRLLKWMKQQVEGELV